MEPYEFNGPLQIELAVAEDILIILLAIVAIVLLQLICGIIWIIRIFIRGKYSLRELLLLTAYWAVWLTFVMMFLRIFPELWNVTPSA